MSPKPAARAGCLILAVLCATAASRAESASITDSAAIDREALVRRHNVVVRSIDPKSPLTVGNGEFAFTVDVTGMQTFGDYYYANGIPLETQARWCWIQDQNPNGYTLDDASSDFTRADGTTVRLPNKQSSPAGDWLRRNPRLQPLGRLSLEWSDGTPIQREELTDIEQTLDLWTGVITSHYKLRGVPVTVTTACHPELDILKVRIESDLVKEDRLRVKLAFPRGHDPLVKNTPALDWSHSEDHQSVHITSKMGGFDFVQRRIRGSEYMVGSTLHLDENGAIAGTSIKPGPPHEFSMASADESEGKIEFRLWFFNERTALVAASRLDAGANVEGPVEAASASHWAEFWRCGAAVDFSGSTNPLAAKMEERIILSTYLTAVQCAGDVPPQESGLTCNTWYGKTHLEMIWWHTAHFTLWGRPELTAKNLDWFLTQLPAARELAKSRGLLGARWAKMTGPEMRESPGGNPFIYWNEPHPIYLSELLYRDSPTKETLAKYSALVGETAECMVSMLRFDAKRGQYVLGPPLWIAQEIHDQATSQNPCYELAYWRWAIEVAQQWRKRAGLPREAHWDEVVSKMSPLPVFEGKYTALESHPDTWTDIASRHDHPSFLMALGFLPGGPDVDRATMNRTLDAVLKEWDWEAKIWGWDYPMVAMTAARLGRPGEAVEVLLRDGPNNRYTPNGHCPQGSDYVRKSQSEGRTEIAVYLPANGAFLSAVALMVGGWDGCTEEFPGIPKDGTWHVRAEGLERLP